MIAVTVLDTDEYQFDESFRVLVTEIARATEAEVRSLLPKLPTRLNLTIYRSTFVIPEIGATGVTWRKDWITWFVNPWDERGALAIAQASLRDALFHELHHSARRALGARGEGLVDLAIFEGLATVFARDFGGDDAPWGRYDLETVTAWAAEFRAGPDGPQDHWFFQHPDGRRWIGYLVGTYLVDRAMAASGQTARSLVGVPTAAILDWADGLEPKDAGRPIAGG